MTMIQSSRSNLPWRKKGFRWTGAMVGWVGPGPMIRPSNPDMGLGWIFGPIRTALTITVNGQGKLALIVMG
jgi:hypothetical protein